MAVNNDGVFVLPQRDPVTDVSGVQDHPLVCDAIHLDVLLQHTGHVQVSPPDQLLLDGSEGLKVAVAEVKLRVAGDAADPDSLLEEGPELGRQGPARLLLEAGEVLGRRGR